MTAPARPINLSAAARKVEVDNRIPLHFYYRIAGNLLKQRASEAEKFSDDEEDDQEEDHGDAPCGACGENYGADELWICCDICEKWFHGKSVKITPARAEHIKPATEVSCPKLSFK